MLDRALYEPLYTDLKKKQVAIGGIEEIGDERYLT